MDANPSCFEWYDLYRRDIVDHLQKYFDRFSKGISNGWERDAPPSSSFYLLLEAEGFTINNFIHSFKLKWDRFPQGVLY